MSVTLRDAQHLCWKNFRKINDKLDPERSRGWTPFVIVTDLLEEAGEVAAVVKGLEGFKPPGKSKTKEMLAAELSACFTLFLFWLSIMAWSWRKLFFRQ